MHVQHSTRVVFAGTAMLVAGILTDVLGSELQLLSILIFSLAISIAGAVVAIRGVFEFMAEKIASRASKRRSV